MKDMTYMTDMMRRTLAVFLLLTSITAGKAWAKELYPIPDAPQAPVTTATVSEITQGYLKNELIGIQPQVGVLLTADQAGSPISRAVYGLGAEVNLVPMISRDWNFLYGGISSGVLYSHLGDPGSNIFGSNSATPIGSGGSNLVIIPANLKVGFNLLDNLRIAAHGGGNVLYRSIASSIPLGSSSVGTGSVWNIFPNVGGDLELGMGRNVSLLLRPDWTFTPGASLFTGVAALNFLVS